jgi:hypothetical protein
VISETFSSQPIVPVMLYDVNNSPFQYTDIGVYARELRPYGPMVLAMILNEAGEKAFQNSGRMVCYNLLVNNNGDNQELSMVLRYISLSVLLGMKRGMYRDPIQGFYQEVPKILALYTSSLLFQYPELKGRCAPQVVNAAFKNVEIFNNVKQEIESMNNFTHGNQHMGFQQPTPMHPGMQPMPGSMHPNMPPMNGNMHPGMQPMQGNMHPNMPPMNMGQPVLVQTPNGPMFQYPNGAMVSAMGNVNNGVTVGPNGQMNGPAYPYNAVAIQTRAASDSTIARWSSEQSNTRPDIRQAQYHQTDNRYGDAVAGTSRNFTEVKESVKEFTEELKYLEIEGKTEMDRKNHRITIAAKSYQIPVRDSYDKVKKSIDALEKDDPTIVTKTEGLVVNTDLVSLCNQVRLNWIITDKKKTSAIFQEEALLAIPVIYGNEEIVKEIQTDIQEKILTSTEPLEKLASYLKDHAGKLSTMDDAERKKTIVNIYHNY